MTDPATPPGDGAQEGTPRRFRPLFLAPVMLFVGLALLFGLRLGSGVDPSRVPSALVGQPAPSFVLEPLPGLVQRGQAVPGLASADLRSRVTVVNFWASWCGPCQVEHPLLTRLAAEPGLRLVGINYKDSPENARRFLGRHGNPFQAVGVDPGGRTAIDWGVAAVPETFVVGPDGRIRHKHVGELTEAALPGFLDEVRRAAR